MSDKNMFLRVDNDERKLMKDKFYFDVVYFMF